MLMMKKLNNFESEHPKNVLIASVVHGISCLFKSSFCIWCWQDANFVKKKFFKKFKMAFGMKKSVKAAFSFSAIKSKKLKFWPDAYSEF
jgi:hypothetical protein